MSIRKELQDYYDSIIQIYKASVPPETGSPEEYAEALYAMDRNITTFAVRNDSIIKSVIFPAIENINSLSPEEISEWQEFAEQLCSNTSSKDPELAGIIFDALLLYARRNQDRDLLIRTLYNLGMVIYQCKAGTRKNNLSPEDSHKQRICFKEAASYFRVYDEIENPTTRMYILRSMGNLCLAYGNSSTNDVIEKVKVIDHALAVFTNPEIQAQNPDFPWERFVLSMHQNRTTFLGYLRRGCDSPALISKVMESALYINDYQKKKNGDNKPELGARWQCTYYQALFFGGMLSLEECLDFLFDLVRKYSAPDTEFSSDQAYAILSVPGFCSDLAHSFGEKLTRKYHDTIFDLYKEAFEYVRKSRVEDHNMLHSLMYTLLAGYHEDVVQTRFNKGHIIREATKLLCPRLFMHGLATAHGIRYMVKLILRKNPEMLLGFMGYNTVSELHAHSTKICSEAYYMGLLHDVGLFGHDYLIGCPVRSRFVSEDVRIADHTVIGAELLEGPALNVNFANAARYHHSKEDQIPDDIPGKPIIGILGIVSDIELLYSPTRYLSLSEIPYEAALERVLNSHSFYKPNGIEEVIRKHKDRLKQVMDEGRFAAACQIWEGTFME